MPGTLADLLADLRLGNDEGLAVVLVELDGDVARDLDVLLLVLAHGHDVRVVDQDVRRHQHRVGEQAVVERRCPWRACPCRCGSAPAGPSA